MSSCNNESEREETHFEEGERLLSEEKSMSSGRGIEAA